MSVLTREQVPGFLFLMDQIQEVENELRISTRREFIKTIAAHDSVSISEKTIRRLFRLRDFFEKESPTLEDMCDIHAPAIPTLNQMTRFYANSSLFSFEDHIEDYEEIILEKHYHKKASVKALDAVYGIDCSAEHEIPKKVRHLVGKIKSTEKQNQLLLELLEEVGVAIKPKKEEVDYEKMVNQLCASNLKLVRYLKIVGGVIIVLASSEISAIQDLFADIQESVFDGIKGYDEEVVQDKNEIPQKARKLVEI